MLIGEVRGVEKLHKCVDAHYPYEIKSALAKISGLFYSCLEINYQGPKFISPGSQPQLEARPEGG